jgi:GNAT superfamily N-acetyltransferase
VGVVSVKGSLIENLYILPEEQRKGYGTKLLFFAMEKCEGTPVLWILGNNSAAYSLYTKYGFKLTGKRNELSDTVYEIEMSK